MEHLRFLIVEDHPEMARNNCEWLQKTYPEAHCETIENPQLVGEKLKKYNPDLVVVDLLYGQNSGEQSAEPGLNLLRYIFGEYPRLNIMVYSSEPLLLSPVSEMISRHEGGFVTVNKMDRRIRFVEGVKSALEGELKIPRELRGLIKLTDREREILELLCKDSLTDQAVADRIHTSKKTVQNSIQRLKEKMGIPLDEEETNSRVALCMEAMRKKLVSL
ncbi:MAG: LuxR C-terminal-related transcriptional regulator [Gloeobacterales cyanobacterium]